jgi:acetyltransferase-like isoleucine patch superfamily enzyme
MSGNVALITGNHDLYNYSNYNTAPIRIDDYSWIGFGCIILPGVHLGPHTIVAAGATVTKSFPQGFCVVAGNPAQIIKTLDPNKVEEIRDYPFTGF